MKKIIILSLIMTAITALAMENKPEQYELREKPINRWGKHGTVKSEESIEKAKEASQSNVVATQSQPTSIQQRFLYHWNRVFDKNDTLFGNESSKDTGDEKQTKDMADYGGLL